MNRLEQLTPQQEALLPDVREEWLRIGLCTERADRPAAEAGVAAAYRAAGLQPPSHAIWLGSPMAGIIGTLMLASGKASWGQARGQVWEKFWSQVQDQVRDQLWNQVLERAGENIGDKVGDPALDQVLGLVGDPVADQTRDQLRQLGDKVPEQLREEVLEQLRARDQARQKVLDGMRDSVLDQVLGQVGDPVGSQIWERVLDQFRQLGDQVPDLVWDHVRDQLLVQGRNQVGEQVLGQVWEQVGDESQDLIRDINDQNFRGVGGQHDASWLSIYDAFWRFGFPGFEGLHGFAAVAIAAGWWWPFRNAVILTERPTELHLDNQGCLTAIQYPDGWGFHA